MSTITDIYSAYQDKELPDFMPDKHLNDPALYKPPRALENAVNISIHLGKPLILTGEPGTGKTQLAYNVAYRFGLGEPLVFNTRTTSTATDLFYRYDALKHLQHVHAKQGEMLTDGEIENRFVRYQALGKAIRSGERKVVLIDEIDKAPRDLPNDILNVLEDMQFEVPEINRKFLAPAAKRPIIILTSNSEKNLPDAFLRRCVYYHLNFPSEEELLSIVEQKISSNHFTKSALREFVVPHFYWVREKLKRKKPSVSELLHWVSLLSSLRFPAHKLLPNEVLNDKEAEMLQMTYSVLAKNEEDVKILFQYL